MGLRLKWLAVPIEDGPLLIDRLGLEPVGETSDERRIPYCCTETPQGWFVLTVRDERRVLEHALSQAPSDALAFEMSEIVMYSRARCLSHGKEVWSVTHDPDKDVDGFDVVGDAPLQLEAIARDQRAKRDADQDDDVDFMFDVPIELSRALCGYLPQVSLGLEWTILGKKPSASPSRSGRQPPSLSAAMRSELLPLLTSLGWEMSAKPDLVTPNNISRKLDGLEQMIWFEFEQGQETYINVHFGILDKRGPERLFALAGGVKRPRTHVPFWRGFGLKLNQRRAEPATPASEVGLVVEQARREVLIVDAFLKTGELDDRLYVESFRGSTIWPGPQSAHQTEAERGQLPT